MEGVEGVGGWRGLPEQYACNLDSHRADADVLMPLALTGEAGCVFIVRRKLMFWLNRS